LHTVVSEIKLSFFLSYDLERTSGEMVWASIVSIFPYLIDIDDLNINVLPRGCIPEERVCGDFSAGLHQQALAWLLGP
jgi:hypothetical protein